MSTFAGILTHSRDSPYTRRVRIVLAELGIAYESRLHPSVYAIDGLQQLNPNLRIPVWQDDQGVLFDSMLIVEYLLQRYGPAVPPAAPEGAPGLAPWLRRSEAPWADGKLLATLEDLTDAGFLLRQLSLSGVEEQQVRYLQRVRQRIPATLHWLEAQATPEGFVPGWFGLPDVWLIAALEWAEFRGMYAWRHYPNLSAIVERAKARPSVAGTAHEK